MEFSKLEKIGKWVVFEISFIIIVFLIFSYFMDNIVLKIQRRPFVDGVFEIIGYLLIILIVNTILNLIFFKKIKHPKLSLIFNIISILFIIFLGNSFNPY